MPVSDCSNALQWSASELTSLMVLEREKARQEVRTKDARGIRKKDLKGVQCGSMSLHERCLRLQARVRTHMALLAPERFDTLLSKSAVCL